MTKIKLTTSSQRDAIEWSGGPRLIIAGPGSGKTYVLTQCIAHLINEKGVDPQQILAVSSREAVILAQSCRLWTLPAKFFITDSNFSGGVSFSSSSRRGSIFFNWVEYVVFFKFVLTLPSIGSFKSMPKNWG